MKNLMESFGLNMDNLDAFGFDAGRAQLAFTETAVVDFVDDLFENALPTGLSWDGDDYFNFAKQADEVLNSFPEEAQVGFSYVDYMNTLNQQMLSSTGHGLADLHVSISNGVITGTVDGVGSGSVNILDAINTALEEVSKDPAFQGALDTINDLLGDELGTDLGGLIGDLVGGGGGLGGIGDSLGDLLGGGDDSSGDLTDLIDGLLGDDATGGFDLSDLGGDLGDIDLSTL